MVKNLDAIAATLAFVLTSAFIGAIVMLSWRDIPRSNEQLLTYMLGQLSGFVSAAVSVYFVRRATATPQGTQDDPFKTEIINKPNEAVPVKEEGEEK